LLLRAFLGVSNFLVYHQALTMLPLALAMVIYQTAPIWTSFLGICFLGESMTICDSIGVLLCFGCVIGITLLAPERDSLDSDFVTHNDEELDLDASSPMLIGIITIFLGSWLSASMNVATGALKGVHFTVVVLFN
jgi:drug/metabolite transporter (DMT)-like permease